jgi:hypothetical protein
MLRQGSCANLLAQFNVRANRETTARPMTIIVEFRELDFLIQNSITLERPRREFIEKNRLAAHAMFQNRMIIEYGCAPRTTKLESQNPNEWILSAQCDRLAGRWSPIAVGKFDRFSRSEA